MAAPTYATDLTLIDAADAVGNYSALGGGSAGLANETDYWVETPQCVSKAGFTAATKGFILNTGTNTVAAGDAVFVWMKQNNRNLMDTIANGGMQVLIGDGTADYDHFYVDGSNSDGSDLAGWRTYAVDPTQTPSTTTGTPTTTNRVGAMWKILSSGSLKGNPNAMDVSRHGRELQCTAGDLALGYATFDGAAVFDAANTRRWGILTPSTGGYLFHGAFVMGTVATAVDFRDSDRSIVVLDDLFVPSTFNEFEIRNASSNVEWTNIIIQHLGTLAPSVLTLDVGTFTGDTCQFSGCGTTTFASTSSCVNTVWTNCEEIYVNGADLSGSAVLTPNVAANTSGLVWDVNGDPNSDLHGMTFSKTSGTAHHAIEFGTTIPSGASYTLTGCQFGTDFSATEGGTTGDETFHFKDTTGTITLNLVGCSGNFGYRTEGVSVDIVIDPVTTKVTCEDQAGDPLENVRVFLETADNGGGTGLPYQAATTSLTQTAGTATCTTSAVHGLATNDYVVIRGASDELYNKQAQITVTGTTTFTYTVDSGASASAGGTPVVSYAPISGLTNASGIAQSSKTWPASQGLKGWARKSTSAPYYKTSRISVTDASGGTDILVLMISDE